MNIGQKVKIKGTNSVWDGKEGILEDVNEDTCTVFVDFIPSEHKRVRQDFNIDNIDFGDYTNNSEVQSMQEDLKQTIPNKAAFRHVVLFVDQGKENEKEGNWKFTGSEKSGEYTFCYKDEPIIKCTLRDIQTKYGPAKMTTVKPLVKEYAGYDIQSVLDDLKKFHGNFCEIEESLTEDDGEDEIEENDDTSKIIKALAEHFGVSEDEIEVSTWGGGHNFIVGNEEYWVGTYDEAYEEAVEMAKSNLDDLGLEALSPDYRDYAIRNFGDADAVEDWMRESFEYYIEDIKDENDSEFENRLISEMYDVGILTDEDFEEFEGEPDHTALKDNVDIEAKKEEYLDKLCDQDAIQWLFDNFGDEEASKILVDNNAIDYDKIAEDCVDTDGIAHFVANYDGDEIELADNLYAYRRG